jgi:hypothetical protein
MRRITDESGKRWDVALGRESWGSFVLLFTPLDGGEARKATLASETMLQADQELDSLSDEALRERFTRSEPWA